MYEEYFTESHNMLRDSLKKWLISKLVEGKTRYL